MAFSKNTMIKYLENEITAYEKLLKSLKAEGKQEEAKSFAGMIRGHRRLISDIENGFVK